MTDKFIWVIAGGIMQIPLLKECKKREYRVLLTDGNPEAPGKKYADEFVNIDTYDVDAHLNLAYALKAKPDAVLTAGADVGPTVSAVADELGLPAVGYEIATRVRNKALMRKALEIQVPVWKEIRFNDIAPIVTWKIHCQRQNIDPFPCVIKPLEKAGSRGISKVDNAFQWDRAMKLAKNIDGGKHDSFLVEQVLDAEIEIATDNFIINGKVVFANAVKRYFSKDVFGLELGHTNPYQLNNEIKRKIRWAAKKLGVDCGPFKCDFIYNRNNGWVVAECATRLSGGFDHMYAAPIATGKDITGFMLDMALGEELTSRDSRLWNTKKQFAFTYAPILQPGKISKLPISFPGSPDYRWLKYFFTTAKDGIVPKIENCSERPLFIIVEGSSEFQAIKRAKLIERVIKEKLEYAS